MKSRVGSAVAGPGRVVFAQPMPDPVGEQIVRSAGHELLNTRSTEELRQVIGTVDALYVRRPVIADRALIEAGRRLKVIGTAGAGLDGIDVEYATAAGIAVVNAPGVGAVAVAEHTVGLALALARQTPWVDRMTRRGEFAVRYQAVFEELAGKTVSLVGFGAIARAVAYRLGVGLGMKVVVFSPSASSRAPEPGVEVTLVGSLQEALAVGDIVSLHLPLTPATRHLIGREELRSMKPTAWLINTARGAIVDEAALVEALTGGVIAGAALDVFEQEPADASNPLFALDNVIVSPHVGGLNRPTAERLSRTAAEGICNVLAGRRPAHLVNPVVWPETKE